MNRKQYVYRLDVTYPDGSLEVGWEPENWASICQDNCWPSTDHDGDTSFRWPRERMFLSESAAEARARRLRQFGAHAVVVRSREIQWADVDAALAIWTAAFELRAAARDNEAVLAISDALVSIARSVAR